jgi:hypothetical protein
VSAPRRLAWTLAAAALTACAHTGAGTRDARLREDCGGFEPAAPVVDAAQAFARSTDRDAALAAMSPRDRVEMLRAGLRLADDAAARACAARLEWEQIDRWECARCVDLLVDGVQRLEGEGDLESLRSYLGSVELSRYLRALPPPMSRRDPTDYSVGAVHRIARWDHIPDYVALATRRDPELADTALSDLGLLGRWNDDFREEVQRAFLANAGAPAPDGLDDGQGLSPALAASLSWFRLDPVGSKGVKKDESLDDSDLRWLWESTPGPRDAILLTLLAERWPDNPFGAGGVALTLLGKLGDAESLAYLQRRAAEDEDTSAVWALARRGDAAMIGRTEEMARKGEQFALAVLMEADPKRARRLIEETLLGPDDAAANEILDALTEFAVPGAWWEPLGYEWRRTSFDGFERAALAAKIPALRLGWIGITVPGCRTRAIAEAVAKSIAPGDLAEDHLSDVAPSRCDLGELAAFLETNAPATFTSALRRIRAAKGDDAQNATEWLVAMGDPETAAAVVAEPAEERWSYVDLARSRAPAVVAHLAARIREVLATSDPDNELSSLVEALAVAHGLSREAAQAFTFGERPVSRAAAEAALAGRPLDALAEVLAASPDDMLGAVGAADDPRVRAYLARLRERRELGLYWYATGQLAVLGDPAARADFWGAMQDGRYRIMDGAEEFERTLGWDLAATMPFWIEELRSQCCRIVTGSSGNIVERVLGGEDYYHSPYRTAYRRAKEVWDAAGGRFVPSRILSDRTCPRFVPAPR